ncbi:MAG: hypothetical protein V3S26_06875, partial [Acidimicrobiia bacterium]
MDPVVVAVVVVVVVGVGVAAYVMGKAASSSSTDADPQDGRRLEEYDFYPFVVNLEGHVDFDADAFNEAVAYFLNNRNERAARELIVIGEQNLVRDTFSSDRLQSYKELYAAYDGDGVVNDNDMFLENY